MSNAPSVRLSQKFLLALAAVCLTGSLFAGTASARTWSGTAFYTGATLTPTPQTLMLSVTNGRVRISSMQVVMACTGGSGPELAFWVSSRPTVILRSNRFSFDFIESSNGGRTGRVRLSGRLGSNGRGTALSQISTANRPGGAFERCSARVNFSSLRRGPR